MLSALFDWIAKASASSVASRTLWQSCPSAIETHLLADTVGIPFVYSLLFLFLFSPMKKIGTGLW